MTNDLTPKKPDGISGLLGRTVDNLVQGFTGLAASDKKEVALSVGHIIQRVRAGKFVQTVKDEWEGLVAKGKIKEGFAGSEPSLDCLQELLDFIDRDIPDTERFEAMKNLYLNIATDADSTKPDYLPQQLMRVCRSLSSGEVVTLLTAYRLSQSEQGRQGEVTGFNAWRDSIAEESGLYKALVEVHDEGLIAKRLFFPRTGSNGARVYLGKHYRLTDLGISLCQWIAAPPA
jgi:hypothetical protein